MIHSFPKHKVVCALEYSKKNPKRHISVLVKGGKIIARGESTLGGKPFFSGKRGRSCHSEMSVIKIINPLADKRKIAKYVIWNVRWSLDGKPVNAKPCKNCQIELIKFGIKTIIYSTDDGTFIKANLYKLQCFPSSGFRY